MCIIYKLQQPQPFAVDGNRSFNLIYISDLCEQFMNALLRQNQYVFAFVTFSNTIMF